MTRPDPGEPRDPVTYLEPWTEIGNLTDAVPESSWRRGGIDGRVMVVETLARVFQVAGVPGSVQTIAAAAGGPYLISDQTDFVLISPDGLDMQIDLNLSAGDIDGYRLRASGMFGINEAAGTRLDMELTFATNTANGVARIPGSFRYWGVNSIGGGGGRLGVAKTFGLLPETPSGGGIINVRMRARSVAGTCTVREGLLVVEMIKV